MFPFSVLVMSPALNHSHIKKSNKESYRSSFAALDVLSTENPALWHIALFQWHSYTRTCMGMYQGNFLERKSNYLVTGRMLGRITELANL